MTFVLSWWGDATQTQKLDNYFKSLFINWKKILYIPWAFYPDRYLGCYEWITSIFGSDEWFEVCMVDEKNISTVNYEQYDGMYIWWGNTYRLLHLIKQNWCDRIINYFALNKLLYGWSAWALILTENISSCGGDINIYNTSYEDSKWINLTQWVNIFCHYKVKYMQLYKDFTKYHFWKHIALWEWFGLIFNNWTMSGYGEWDYDLYQDWNILDKNLLKLWI